jgi:membrane peptidoglycan carboxypeptidase
VYRVLLQTLYGDRTCPASPGLRIRSGTDRVASRRTLRLPRWVWLAALLAAVASLELRTSWVQSMVLARAVGRLTYTLGPGRSASIRFPVTGPYDIRLGYAKEREFVKRLEASGYEVEAQARWSPQLVGLADAGFFPVYPVKNQAGLSVLDRSDRSIFSSRSPRYAYRDFTDIPPVVVQSLLFIENRELLRTDHPYRNPAVEYDRLAKAVLDVGLNRLVAHHPVSGGSTLAVQLEKLRHSPEGRTTSVAEKGRQIVAASLRSYLDGANTTDARKRLVTEYVNSMPLGAIAGLGEVIGLGDGLQAWYRVDVGDVNATLMKAGLHRPTGSPARTQIATAYRQALSLLVAVKRPSVYLSGNHDELDARINAYLPALASAGIIPAWLRDEVLRVRLAPYARASVSASSPLAERKGVDAVRVELGSQLGVVNRYDLDRFDLTVRTTLDGAINDAVTRALRQVGDCEAAAHAGLVAFHLLNGHACGQVVYSFTLYERVAGGNALRVQADNYDQPLNINEGTKLELGSTAKLRALVTYLELVEGLHRLYAHMPASALRSVTVHPRDHLTRWAIGYLTATEDRSLPAMLDAAMNRTYPASPDESFFTGGGVHRFENFDAKDNSRVTTVRDAFQRSINLVFIRLMRDVVDHLTCRRAELTGILEDGHHPKRAVYLARFADWEGRAFLRKFHAGLHGASPDETLRKVARRRAASSRIHPLEGWLLDYLAEYPESDLRAVFRASAGARQHAYDWLFKTPRRAAQNRAIAIMLEADAFAEIHVSWRRLGYPFPSLVPSYATAIGSSGDNPSALSTLMGIIVNDGLRDTSFRIDQVHFAMGTPYETRLTRKPTAGERVLSPAVASLLRHELVGVVEHGTGRRVAGGLTLENGQTLDIGGKTGTGDNRFETSTSSRVMNRTAAFTFFVGDRLFGTMVAYVPGEAAAGYAFTSALPVQMVKNLLPVLEPLLRPVPSPGVRRVEALHGLESSARREKGEL